VPAHPVPPSPLRWQAESQPGQLTDAGSAPEALAWDQALLEPIVEPLFG